MYGRQVDGDTTQDHSDRKSARTRFSGCRACAGPAPQSGLQEGGRAENQSCQTQRWQEAREVEQRFVALQKQKTPSLTLSR